VPGSPVRVQVRTSTWGGSTKRHCYHLAAASKHSAMTTFKGLLASHLWPGIPGHRWLINLGPTDRPEVLRRQTETFD
jgi:hypothetical protein